MQGMNEKSPGMKFQHDCEVSLGKEVDKCHYLGTQVDGDDQVMDLYIHVRDQGGNTELLARFGDEGGDYLCASLPSLFYRSVFHQELESESVRVGPEGYGIRMAYDAAKAAGYNLEALAREQAEKMVQLAQVNFEEMDDDALAGFFAPQRAENKPTVDGAGIEEI